MRRIVLTARRVIRFLPNLSEEKISSIYMSTMSFILIPILIFSRQQSSFQWWIMIRNLKEVLIQRSQSWCRPCTATVTLSAGSPWTSSRQWGWWCDWSKKWTQVWYDSFFFLTLPTSHKQGWTEKPQFLANPICHSPSGHTRAEQWMKAI